MRLRHWLAGLLSCSVGAVAAAEALEVCFNYGCAERALVFVSGDDLQSLAAPFAQVVDAAGERQAIAEALAGLYRIAGGQTPIVADRGGNLADRGVEGRMDCIDHSVTTSRMLALMVGQGWLRHHRVVARARRTRFLAQHFAAVVEQLPDPEQVGRNGAGSDAVPDHVATLLALCDCPEVVNDAAHMRANADLRNAQVGARHVVDTWFLDHAEPALVLPLADWMEGEGPNVQ